MDLVRNAMPGWRSPLNEDELDERAGLERLPMGAGGPFGSQGFKSLPRRQQKLIEQSIF